MVTQKKPIKRSRVFLDGMRGGAKLFRQGTSIRMSSEDAKVVRAVMKAATGGTRDVNEKGELRIPVQNRAKMHMVLRRDKRNKKVWYLNVDGNPATFFIGDNIYGFEDAEAQIKGVFRRCIRAIEKSAGMKMPEGVMKDVEDGNIHLNALEFAGYTMPVQDPSFIISCWRTMFRRGNMIRDGEFQKLDQVLGVKTNTDHENSFSLWLLKNKDPDKPAKEQPDVKHVMFLAYNKVKEMETNWRSRNSDGSGEEDEHFVSDKELERVLPINKAAAMADIENRVRYDVGFTSAWFSSKGLTTVAKLGRHIRKTFGGSWPMFVSFYVSEVFRRGGLMDMWTFDLKKVERAYEDGLEVVPGLNPDIPLDAYIIMAEARKELGMLTRDQMMKKIRGDPKWLVEYAERAKGLPMTDMTTLALDMSKVGPEIDR